MLVLLGGGKIKLEDVDHWGMSLGLYLALAPSSVPSLYILSVMR
jgi:hypothetical protein